MSKGPGRGVLGMKYPESTIDPSYSLRFNIDPPLSI